MVPRHARRKRAGPMAGSVNKVILVGNLGRDPEVRHTQGNQKIVHLAVATSERWKDRQSAEPRERTEWHRVVIFNENLVEIAERYLRKGSPVYLEGTLQTRKWTDQGGQERYPTEIGSPEDARDTSYRSPAPGSGPSERGPVTPAKHEGIAGPAVAPLA